jgi:hypothetical protein
MRHCDPLFKFIVHAALDAAPFSITHLDMSLTLNVWAAIRRAHAAADQ